MKLFGLFLLNLILPGSAKDEMDLVMQVSAQQHFPFILIEPDPTTITAAIQVEVDAMPNFLVGQEMPTFRT